MRYHLLAALGLLSVSAFSAGPGLAQTATDSFGVTITITSECLINSASDLNFGSVGIIDSAVQATSAIAVQCTNATPYEIGLNAGTGTGATVATRLMTGPAGATVVYSLYTDAARTDIWGDTALVNTVAATGSGSEQSYTVYGQVPVQPTPAGGTYTDTVTVTVTY